MDSESYTTVYLTLFHFLFLAPDFNRDGWFNEKFTLGLDFPNVSTSAVGIAKTW